MQQSKPRILITVVVLIVHCIIAGCASVSKNAHLEDGARLVPLIINSPEGRMQLPYASDERALIVGLRATGGSFVGLVEKQQILLPVSQESFLLPSKSSIFVNVLDELRELSPLSYPEIVIQPAETKIARIGLMTFDRYLYENDFKRDIGYTSIVDMESGNDLLQIAVDRPCYIVGSLSMGGETAEFDVRFESAGVHFLTVVRPSKGQAIVRELPHQVRPKLVVETYASYRNWITANHPSKGVHRAIPVLAD